MCFRQSFSNPQLLKPVFNTFKGSTTILRIIASRYPEAVKLVYFNHFYPTKESMEQVTEDDLSEKERNAISLRRNAEPYEKKFSYFMRKLFLTIGPAIATSPLATLLWVSERYRRLCDARCLLIEDILDLTALWWMTDCVALSISIFNIVSGPLCSIFLLLTYFCCDNFGNLAPLHTYDRILDSINNFKRAII